MNSLVESKCVVQIAAQIIFAAKDADREAKEKELEENKQSIQMQELESGANHGIEE